MNHVRYLLSLRYKKTVYCGRVAQLDRVPGYEPGGRRFDSCRVRHIKRNQSNDWFFLLLYFDYKNQNINWRGGRVAEGAPLLRE